MKTKILIEKEWKYFFNLIGNEILVQLNQKTKEAEFVLPASYAVFGNNKERYKIENGDLVVSEKQKVYAKDHSMISICENINSALLLNSVSLRPDFSSNLSRICSKSLTSSGGAINTSFLTSLFLKNSLNYSLSTLKQDSIISGATTIFTLNSSPISLIMMLEKFKNDSIIFKPEEEHKAANLDSFIVAQPMLEVLEVQDGYLIQRANLLNLSHDSTELNRILSSQLVKLFGYSGNISIHNESAHFPNSWTVIDFPLGSFNLFFNFSMNSCFKGSSSTGYQSILSQNFWSSSDRSPVFMNLSNISFFIVSSLATSDQFIHENLPITSYNLSSNGTVMLAIYNPPLLSNSSNFSSFAIFLLNPSLITSGQFTSGSLSNLSLRSSGIDTVNRFILNTSNFLRGEQKIPEIFAASCNCVDTCKCMNIYKGYDYKVKEDYNLIPVTEAYDLANSGKELYFMDENGSEIKVKSINKVNYTGKIYDVDVPSDIVLVRRKNENKKEKESHNNIADSDHLVSHSRGSNFSDEMRVPSSAHNLSGDDYLVVWSGNSNFWAKFYDLSNYGNNGTAYGNATQIVNGKFEKEERFDGNIASYSAEKKEQENSVERIFLSLKAQMKLELYKQSKSSIISLVDNTSTLDWRLNPGSLDQIGQPVFNARAR